MTSSMLSILPQINEIPPQKKQSNRCALYYSTALVTTASFLMFLSLYYEKNSPFFLKCCHGVYTLNRMAFSGEHLYLICDSPLYRSARRSFAPSQKSRHNCSYV